MEKRIRCFIALGLSKEAKDEIEKIQKQIEKSDLLEAKFTKRDLVHLTLKFLGEINETMVEKVREKLREINFDEFEVELGEVGVFSKKFIKIIWIKLNGKEIFELQKQIDDKLKNLFEKEERFMSHITIARVKIVGDKKSLIDYIKSMKIKNIKFKIDKFFLRKSELFPGGPVYTDLGVYNLEKKK